MFSRFILITSALLVLSFVLPYGISAEDDLEQSGIVDAEKYLNAYRSLSLDPFLEEELEVFEQIKPVYNTDCNYYLYSGYYGFGQRVTRKTWGHALELYRSGKIHGAQTDYQCTFFAQMWFYDIYGFNSTGNRSSGNGADMAYRVYQANTYYDDQGELQHYFELSNKPKPMSILSVSGMSNSLGHVICIDEVDYDNDTITFSDGNATGSGDIRIRVTMTMEEFYRTNPGHYVYATPTLELLQLIGYQ